MNSFSSNQYYLKCSRVFFKKKIKKTQTTKQKRNRLINTENTLTVARQQGGWGMGEKGDRIKKYKLAVTEQSLGHKIQHREYGHNIVTTMYSVRWVQVLSG